MPFYRSLARLRDQLVASSGIVRRAPPAGRYHFLHISKTGGTAVVHALNQAHRCTRSPRRARSALPDPYQLNPPLRDARPLIVVHPHDEGLRDVPPGEKVFFFLRDPVSRFVSVFYSRQRQGRPRYETPWSPEETALFERFRSACELAEALSAPDEAERAAARQALTGFRNVGQPYWSWFENDGYLRSRLADIVLVGFQENLAQGFEVLKAKLGLPTGLHLPDDPVLAHKNPVVPAPPLSEQAAAALRDWFRADYDFLALCRDLFGPDVLVAGDCQAESGGQPQPPPP